ncbi:MAG: lipopolysaccharide kinase InaA family protein [Psychroflexus sp.]|nr:lipopolysaccharide kinase InaA family protein [Psychroflexus sp.]MDR9448801.1 lipopolysaccharide kinase InaA family protein [Psychroflexus sp.]
MKQINYQFHPNYKNQKDQIFQIIEKFDQIEEVVYSGKRNTLKKVTLNDQNLAIKKFHQPIIFKRIIYTKLRSSKAKRSFDNANYLLKHNIYTPQPVCYIENYNFGLLTHAYYISIFVNYDYDFHDILHNEHINQRNDIITGLARFTFRLHQANVLFKDHSPGNTLIKRKTEGFDYFLIDLNRMQFKPLSFDERMQNFARITPYKWMVDLLSEEYARLIKKDKQEVFPLMWQYVSAFQKKFHRKKRIKKRLGI